MSGFGAADPQFGNGLDFFLLSASSWALSLYIQCGADPDLLEQIQRMACLKVQKRGKPLIHSGYCIGCDQCCCVDLLLPSTPRLAFAICSASLHPQVALDRSSTAAGLRFCPCLSRFSWSFWLPAQMPPQLCSKPAEPCAHCADSQKQQQQHGCCCGCLVPSASAAPPARARAPAAAPHHRPCPRTSSSAASVCIRPLWLHASPALADQQRSLSTCCTCCSTSPRQPPHPQERRFCRRCSSTQPCGMTHRLCGGSWPCRGRPRSAMSSDRQQSWGAAAPTWPPFKPSCSRLSHSAT